MQMSSISTSSPTIQLPQLLLTSDPCSLPEPAACPCAVSPHRVPVLCPHTTSSCCILTGPGLAGVPGAGVPGAGVQGCPPGPCPMAELPPPSELCLPQPRCHTVGTPWGHRSPPARRCLGVHRNPGLPGTGELCALLPSPSVGHSSEGPRQPLQAEPVAALHPQLVLAAAGSPWSPSAGRGAASRGAAGTLLTPPVPPGPGQQRPEAGEAFLGVPDHPGGTHGPPGDPQPQAQHRPPSALRHFG